MKSGCARPPIAAEDAWLAGCEALGLPAFVATLGTPELRCTAGLRGLLRRAGWRKRQVGFANVLDGDGAGLLQECARSAKSIVRPVAAHLTASGAWRGPGGVRLIRGRSVDGFSPTHFLGVLETSVDAVDPVRATAAGAPATEVDLLSGAGHGLRNGLAGLGYATEIVQVELANGRLESARHFLGRLEGSLQRLSRQVFDLQLAQRLKTRQWVLNREQIAVRALMERVQGAVQPVEAASRLVVSVTGAKAVSVDPELVVSLVGQLVGNALQYSDPNSPVTVHWRVAAGRLRIAVGDRGTGIAADHRAKLFNPFVRFQGRGRGTGLGLGLYIARLAAELHGGSIELGEAEHGGTLVRVELAE